MNTESNNLSLRQLRAFVVVAECRSFIAASKKLFITASALSDSIKQLEQTLGVRLFDRTTRSVELTRAGEEFLADATQVLRLIDASLARMGEIGSAARGSVSVAGVASVHANITAVCATALMASRPGIRIALLEDEITSIITSVQSGDVDFGAGVVPQQAMETLDVQHLATDYYGVIARKGHEVFRLAHLPLEAIRTWNYLGVSLGADMDERLSRVNVSSRVRANGFGSMVALLQQGAGVAVLPELAARRMITSDLAFRAFKEPAYERHVSLMKRAGRTLSPAAQLLWDAMLVRAQGLKLPDHSAPLA